MINGDILTELGLSNNEAEVYLIVLNLNEALASNIAKQSKISRPHIYDTLNKLVEKNLISYVNKNNKKYFKATNPNKLSEYIKEKQERLDNIMPDLQKLYQPGKEKPNIEIYEGVEAFKTIFNDILKVGKELRTMGASDRVRKLAPSFYVEKYLKEREKRKIPARQLYADTTGVLRSKMSVFKKLPKEFNFPNTTLIYGNKVAFVIYTKIVTAIIIENEEFAESYKKYFDMLWASVKYRK